MFAHPFRIASVLSLVVIGAGIAGCSSSNESAKTTSTSSSETSTTAATGGGFNCAVADTAAIKAVLGSVPEVEKRSAKGIASCAWYTGLDSYAAVNYGTIGMMSRDYLPAKANGTPVKGIGDEAYIGNQAIVSELYSATGKTLWIRKGDLVYAISVDTTATPNPTEAQLKAIAAPFVK